MNYIIIIQKNFELTIHKKKITSINIFNFSNTVLNDLVSDKKKKNTDEILYSRIKNCL